MTQGAIGYGLNLQAGGVRVAQVVDVKFPSGLKIPSVKITSQDSPADGAGAWHEKLFTIGDAGQVTFNCIASPGVRTQLLALKFQYLVYSVALPQGGSWSCTGFLTSLDDADPLEDRQTVDATIELTGKPVYAGFAPWPLFLLLLADAHPYWIEAAAGVATAAALGWNWLKRRWARG